MRTIMGASWRVTKQGPASSVGPCQPAYDPPVSHFRSRERTDDRDSTLLARGARDCDTTDKKPFRCCSSCCCRDQHLRYGTTFARPHKVRTYYFM